MNCEKAREYFADDLAGTLEQSAAAEFQSHLLECRACREEADQLRNTWTSLERIPDPDPVPKCAPASIRCSKPISKGVAKAETKSNAPSWWRWWPQQPALQFAMSLGLLCTGLVGGYLATVREHKNPKSVSFAERFTICVNLYLSLLQQQSASDRSGSQLELPGGTVRYRSALRPAPCYQSGSKRKRAACRSGRASKFRR